MSFNLELNGHAALSLIDDMIQEDPNKRPKLFQIVERLK